MSADLLAAFGLSDQTNPSPNTLQPSTVTVPAQTADATDTTEKESWILQSQSIPRRQHRAPEEPLWKQDNSGADVLFDASEDEQFEQDGDDFGDFEPAPIQADQRLVPQTQQHKERETDLLGLDSFSDLQISKSQTLPPAPARQNNYGDLLGTSSATNSEARVYGTVQPRSTSQTFFNSSYPGEEQNPIIVDHVAEDDDWGNFEDVEAQHTTPSKPITTDNDVSVQHSMPESTPDDEDWDAFEDVPPTTSSPPQPQPVPGPAPHLSKPTPDPSTATTTQPTKSNTRPTNIPPPSTLLQLLPQIYQILSQETRTPNTSIPALSHANRIVQIYCTTARLIAGRTHRWKRDTLLSQSMRISQAGLKNTGMKLTALDKSESIKEEQDTQEAVTAWSRNAATLNAAMLKAKVQKPPMSLGLNLGIRGANGPGVLNARECCAVCGLKRNERVLGIDVKVDDTFGEFWVEHWGHKDCYDFWYGYEGLLQRR